MFVSKCARVGGLRFIEGDSVNDEGVDIAGPFVSGMFHCVGDEWGVDEPRFISHRDFPCIKAASAHT